MAAPSPGQPVTIVVGAVLRLQVKPRPPRPQRLSAAVTVIWAVLTLARVIFGVVYFKDCPQQPNIPNYLLGLALLSLLSIPCVSFSWERDATSPQEHPRDLNHCLLGLMNLCFYMWILAGDVWVFFVYQPNYDPAAADGLYCDKTLYTFALWNAVWETFAIWVGLARLCKGLLCCVMVTPAPTNRDFSGNV